jgi:hypothetical protein
MRVAVFVVFAMAAAAGFADAYRADQDRDGIADSWVPLPTHTTAVTPASS